MLDDLGRRRTQPGPAGLRHLDPAAEDDQVLLAARAQADRDGRVDLAAFVGTPRQLEQRLHGVFGRRQARAPEALSQAAPARPMGDGQLLVAQMLEQLGPQGRSAPLVQRAEHLEAAGQPQVRAQGDADERRLPGPHLAGAPAVGLFDRRPGLTDGLGFLDVHQPSDRRAPDAGPAKAGNPDDLDRRHEHELRTDAGHEAQALADEAPDLRRDGEPRAQGLTLEDRPLSQPAQAIDARQQRLDALRVQPIGGDGPCLHDLEQRQQGRREVLRVAAERLLAEDALQGFDVRGAQAVQDPRREAR